MSKASKGNKGRGKQRQRSQGHSRKPQYGLRFTEQGRDTLAAIYDQYRDRPMYYVLDEQGEAVPVGQSYLLTAEERTRWHAFYDDPEARTLEETVIPNPEDPAFPVVVHTAFMAMESSFAYPQPNGALVLWQTTLLEETAPERKRAAEADADNDDSSWLLEDVPEAPSERVALAGKLGLDIEAFDEWIRVYSTREEALQGHAETVRWVRRSLGVF